MVCMEGDIQDGDRRKRNAARVDAQEETGDECGGWVYSSVVLYADRMDIRGGDVSDWRRMSGR